MSDEYEFHEIANVFPLLEGEDYSKLVEDIREHGLLDAITLYEDKILDGRNRYRACLDAGVEPFFSGMAVTTWRGSSGPRTTCGDS